MNKIYIIGPVGSGKTTLANKLSKKLNIKHYELDKIVWDDSKNIKRTKKMIEKKFNEIIKKDSWIIEDVGREIFVKGREEADIIYYIKLNRIILYYRIMKRWIKQKLGLEKYNYKQNLKTLIEMFCWVNKDIKNQNNKIEQLKENKLIILNKKNFKKISS